MEKIGKLGQIVCFRHGKYDGKSPPDLTCKVCCKTFIDTVAANQKKIQKEKGLKKYQKAKKNNSMEFASVAGIKPII